MVMYEQGNEPENTNRILEFAEIECFCTVISTYCEEDGASIPALTKC